MKLIEVNTADKLTRYLKITKQSFNMVKLVEDYEEELKQEELETNNKQLIKFKELVTGYVPPYVRSRKVSARRNHPLAKETSGLL